MFEMYLEVANRLIRTGERYDSLADSKTDYPWSIFDVRVVGNKLIANVVTGKTQQRAEMKGRGKDGWCY